MNGRCHIIGPARQCISICRDVPKMKTRKAPSRETRSVTCSAHCIPAHPCRPDRSFRREGTLTLLALVPGARRLFPSRDKPGDCSRRLRCSPKSLPNRDSAASCLRPPSRRTVNAPTCLTPLNALSCFCYSFGLDRTCIPRYQSNTLELVWALIEPSRSHLWGGGALKFLPPIYFHWHVFPFSLSGAASSTKPDE